MNDKSPTVLTLGNYRNLGNIGDDIYRRLLTDTLQRNGVKVVTSTTSPNKVQGIILGGGGVLNAVSFKRLETLQRYGKTMPSAIISCGIEGCVVPDNINELLCGVDIATVRDAKAWTYSQGSAILGADMAFAIDAEHFSNEQNREKIGFSLRIRKLDDLSRLQEVTDKLAQREKGNAVDINTYMRNVYGNRIPIIDNVPDVSYNGSLKDYLQNISKCKLVVCSQYHAVILSVLSGSAVCGYVYSNKVQELVDTLSLQEYFTNDIDKLETVYEKAIRDLPTVEKKLIRRLRSSAFETHVTAVVKMANWVKGIDTRVGLRIN